MCDASRLKLL